MKKFLFLVALSYSALLLFTSCSEQSMFRTFAVDFAHAVNSGDTLKIDTMLAQTGSYQFSQVNLAKIDPDSIQLVEAGEGKYKITSIGEVGMVVAKVDEKMFVEQTWKIFGSEPESVDFALKHDLIKNDDDDKTIYDALHSEEYAQLKEAELAAQKFVKEQEAAQRVIGSALSEFASVVSTMQELYDMDPDALWWSMNQSVLTAAENTKRSLDRQRKYMTPEQQARYQKLESQYNRLINN